MTEQEQAVVARWSEGLPEHLLNKGRPPGRNIFFAILGWLLLDWFIKPQVLIKTVITDEQEHLYMVGIVRFGEVHSFIFNDNAVMSLGVSIGRTEPSKIFNGFVINDKKIGVCTIPKWAVTLFLEEFVKVYVPTKERFAAEMDLATKTEEGKPANVTVH